ncbi:MAG: hypothetical protein Q8M16_01670 [Pirellulaceae bacterium]|nr:hypothetical protein [Pirellulaceae bacterium]
MVAESLEQVFQIQCANCGNACSVGANSILAGGAVTCPHCQSPLVVPAAKAPVASPELRPTESRAHSPTGRLKPVNFFGDTVKSPTVQVVSTLASPTAAPATELEKPPAVTSKAVEQVDAPGLPPTETQPVAKRSAEDSNLSDKEPGRQRSRRRGSSSRRSSSDRSWNEIGVDGLPIKQDSEVEEPAIDSVGTRFQDVAVLLFALAVSLVLTQAGLWWVAGVDPLGLAPVVSGWLPNLVPQSLRP